MKQGKIDERVEYVEKVMHYKCPRYEDLPPIPLYADQLTELLGIYLSEFEIPGDEKFITSTMVNNYVKQKIIPPPNNKKYNKDHIIYLMVIGILKQVLSISEIASLIKMQMHQYSLDVAYNFFCMELENALKATFCTRDFSKFNSATKITAITKLVRSALLSFGNKIYVKKNLYYSDNEQD